MKQRLHLPINFVFALICFVQLSQSAVASTESDTLRHIFSFWHQDYWVKDQVYNYDDILSNAAGDTVLSAMITRTNTTFDDLDTFVIRVRIWETTKGSYVMSSRYTSIQPTGGSRPQFHLFSMQGRPCLIYGLSPNNVVLVDIFTEAVLQHYDCTSEVEAITLSPDGSFSFINVGTRSYRIYNNITGELVLNDDTIYHGPKSTNQYISDLMTTVNAKSWSPDNSYVILRYNEVSVTKPDLTSDLYHRIFRPFNLQTKTYSNQLFRDDSVGQWNADAKRFITYSVQHFFMTDLNGITDSTTIVMDMRVRDFYFVQGSNRILMLGYDNTISIRDMVSGTKYLEFNPGTIIGACTNDSGNVFAYVTSDNVLHILNTLTLQGVFTYTIPIPHEILLDDITSFNFLRGNRVLFMRDHQRHLHFLDIPARAFVADLPETQQWYMSPDGNSLFVLDSIYSRYDCYTGTRICQFPTNEFLHQVLSFGLSPNGNQVVTSDSLSVHVWDLHSQKELMRSGFDMVDACYWSLDSSTIVLQRLDTLAMRHGFIIANAADLQKRYEFAADSNLHFLQFAPNSSRIYFSHGDTLLAYNTQSASMDFQWTFDGNPTSIALQKKTDSCYVGTKKGGVWKGSLSTMQATSVFTNWSPIVRVLVNDAATTLCVSTLDSMVVLRIRDHREIGRLVTKTINDCFIGTDSLCVGIYQDAIVEFQLIGGKPTKYEVKTTPVFRPFHDYYATVGFHPNESLQLFRYSNRFDTRSVEATASRSLLQWSANSQAVAALDLYNNIVVWRPAGLKQPDTVSAVADNEPKATLELAPNPAAEGVYLSNSNSDDSSAPYSNAQITVYNEVGERCLSKSANTAHEWLDLRSLPNGMYVLSIQTAGTLKTARLVVQH